MQIKQFSKIDVAVGTETNAVVEAVAVPVSMMQFLKMPAMLVPNSPPV